MEILIGIVVGFIVGWVLSNISYTRNLTRAVDESLDQLEDHIKKVREKVINAKLEFRDDMIYAFEADTDRFLGQGKNVEELKSTLKAQHPDRYIMITKEDLEKLNAYEPV